MRVSNLKAPLGLQINLDSEARTEIANALTFCLSVADRVDSLFIV